MKRATTNRDGSFNANPRESSPTRSFKFPFFGLFLRAIGGAFLGWVFEQALLNQHWGRVKLFGIVLFVLVIYTVADFIVFVLSILGDDPSAHDNKKTRQYDGCHRAVVRLRRLGILGPGYRGYTANDRTVWLLKYACWAFGFMIATTALVALDRTKLYENFVDMHDTNGDKQLDHAEMAAAVHRTHGALKDLGLHFLPKPDFGGGDAGAEAAAAGAETI